MYLRIGRDYTRRPREENRRDLKALAESKRSPGLLAFEDDLCVGWCLVAPRSELHWLNQRKILRTIDDQPVWAIGCFFIRRTHRRRGIHGELIKAAIETARAAGAPAIEAYPIDTEVPGHTRNTFPGIATTFARYGFEVVARHQPDRPVLRRTL